MPRSFQLFLFIAFVSIPQVACPVTWNVPADAPTIQAGIDSSTAGDTVIVACGTYYECLISMKSGVHLRSETGSADCVTIDAQESGPIFYLEGVDSTATIEGFTVTRGRTAGAYGGGVYSVLSSPTFRNCIFFDNSATSGGGGMYCFVQCHPRISHCVFCGNDAEQGAGLYLVYDSSAALDHVIMAFGIEGEAIYCEYECSATLTCCDVYGNAGGDWVGCIAGQQGINGNFSADPMFCEPDYGDFHLHEDSPCVDAPLCGRLGVLGVGCPRVWHVSTTGSDSTGDGSPEAPFATVGNGIDHASPLGDTVFVACGTYYEHEIGMKSGITLRGETDPAGCVTIDAQGQGSVFHCQNVDSTAGIENLGITGGDAEWGGGIHCSSASPAVRSCTFLNSRAQSGGGAVYCFSSRPTFSHCTFVWNEAPLGAGIYAEDSSPTLANAIIAYGIEGEAVYCDATSGATLACSDVYGNDGGDWVGCIEGQDAAEGNLRADPHFWDPGTGFDPGSGDFRLAWCSPCADAPGCGLLGAHGLAPRGPRVWSVPGDAPTVSAGVDSARSCDTVLVSCGTYQEWCIRILRSGITLRSETGDPCCATIHARGGDRALECYNVSSTTVIEGLTITSGAASHGGGMFCSRSSPTIRHCTFSGNSAHEDGGGMYCCQSSPALSWCTFLENSAEWLGGGMYCLQSSPVLVNCTFSENSSNCGSGIYGMISDVILDNTLIAFSTEGAAVVCVEGSSTILTCCDLYGNAGGDWFGPIADQYGVHGNISEDPLFCDPEGGNFRLVSHDSPCAPHTPPNPACGLIGAHPVGCAWEGITSVMDVPADQGGQVRVTWSAHYADCPHVPEPISQYGVWRRVDGSPARGDVGGPVRLGEAARYPPGTWEFVISVPALGETTYATVCPTLCDSTVAQGMCWTVFYLTAHATNPAHYYESSPDSGYSVDNLEPTAPQGLTAEYDGEAIVLSWEANPEEDFNYYAVYRGEESGFPLGDPIGYSTTPAYMDNDLSGPGEYWYRVTATDFSGNESAPSDQASAATTGVASQTAIPTVFYLGPAIPNPFNPITEISYGIPAGASPSRVTMHVYDATGRQVTTLVDTDQAPGEYRVAWDARDHRGAGVATGVYFYRITWNGKSETRRMVLLK